MSGYMQTFPDTQKHTLSLQGVQPDNYFKHYNSLQDAFTNIKQLLHQILGNPSRVAKSAVFPQNWDYFKLSENHLFRTKVDISKLVGVLKLVGVSKSCSEKYVPCAVPVLTFKHNRH